MAYMLYGQNMSRKETYIDAAGEAAGALKGFRSNGEGKKN